MWLFKCWFYSPPPPPPITTIPKHVLQAAKGAGKEDE